MTDEIDFVLYPPARNGRWEPRGAGKWTLTPARAARIRRALRLGSLGAGKKSMDHEPEYACRAFLRQFHRRDRFLSRNPPKGGSGVSRPTPEPPEAAYKRMFGHLGSNETRLPSQPIRIERRFHS